MSEMWKDIEGYGGLYKVSNLGNVLNVNKGKYLKPSINTDGYYRVNLYKNGSYKGLFIHRLVAYHFIPNPDGKPEVNHIDGNKRNNCVENLEWVTRRENVQHAYNTGLNNVTGENNGRAKLNSKEVFEIKRMWHTGKYSQKVIAEYFGVPRSTISIIVLNRNWKHIIFKPYKYSKLI